MLGSSTPTCIGIIQGRTHYDCQGQLPIFQTLKTPSRPSAQINHNQNWEVFLASSLLQGKKRGKHRRKGDERWRDSYGNEKKKKEKFWRVIRGDFHLPGNEIKAFRKGVIYPAVSCDYANYFQYPLTIAYHFCKFQGFYELSEKWGSMGT